MQATVTCIYWHVETTFELVTRRVDHIYLEIIHLCSDMKVVTLHNQYWPPLHEIGHCNLHTHLKSTCPSSAPLVKFVLGNYVLPVSRATRTVVILHVTESSFASSEPMINLFIIVSSR